MCTVSWLTEERGYHLLFNRDEKRTRAIALPPRLQQRAGVKYVAPVDADFGGTWVAVNEFRLALCLLNATGPAPQPSLSRGFLIPALISRKSAAAAIDWLRWIGLRPFAPFTLVALDAQSPPLAARWNGARLSIEAVRPPLTSSSFNPEQVRRTRLHTYAQATACGHRTDLDALRRFHRHHGRAADAYSTCMHRADAATVSFSSIAVSEHAIHFAYSPAAPCQSVPCHNSFLLPSQPSPAKISPALPRAC
jgi:hypothetical protein